MPSPFENLDRAFSPISETVRWRQDRAPHTERDVEACVLQGASETDAAGSPRGGVSADAWQVLVPLARQRELGISVGDTFVVDNVPFPLTIQSSVSDGIHQIFSCTSDERAPRA